MLAASIQGKIAYKIVRFRAYTSISICRIMQRSINLHMVQTDGSYVEQHGCEAKRVGNSDQVRARLCIIHVQCVEHDLHVHSREVGVS